MKKFLWVLAAAVLAVFFVFAVLVAIGAWVTSAVQGQPQRIYTFTPDPNAEPKGGWAAYPLTLEPTPELAAANSPMVAALAENERIFLEQSKAAESDPTPGPAPKPGDPDLLADCERWGGEVGTSGLSVVCTLPDGRQAYGNGVWNGDPQFPGRRDDVITPEQEAFALTVCQELHLGPNVTEAFLRSGYGACEFGFDGLGLQMSDVCEKMGPAFKWIRELGRCESRSHPELEGLGRIVVAPIWGEFDWDDRGDPSFVYYSRWVIWLDAEPAPTRSPTFLSPQIDAEYFISIYRETGLTCESIPELYDSGVFHYTADRVAQEAQVEWPGLSQAEADRLKRAANTAAETIHNECLLQQQAEVNPEPIIAPPAAPTAAVDAAPVLTQVEQTCLTLLQVYEVEGDVLGTGLVDVDIDPDAYGPEVHNRIVAEIVETCRAKLAD